MTVYAPRELNWVMIAAPIPELEPLTMATFFPARLSLVYFAHFCRRYLSVASKFLNSRSCCRDQIRLYPGTDSPIVV